MSQLNRPFYKSEVKSKIGDYIRGKISAQSLMHPSRTNTKPIDKRQYSLNAPTDFSYANMTKPENHTYHKRLRRPPLKDYIEGRVKLADMISPSKITSIPKERKYHLPEVKSFTQELNEAAKAVRGFDVSFKESIRLNTNESISKASVKTATQEWCLTSYQNLSHNKTPNNPATARTEQTLVPVRPINGHTGSTRRRKVMCKIKKVTKSNNALTNSEEITEERIIEVPEALLRDKKNMPKFLMDRYSIPCSVTCGEVTSTKHKPLAILNDVSNTSQEAPLIEDEPLVKQLADTTTAEGESDNSLMIDVRDSTDTTKDHAAEQGDFNNTTTYIFEFFEGSDTKSAIIEEIDEENPHQRNHEDQAYHDRQDSFCHNIPKSDRFSHYDDYKSQIFLERELLDLHKGMIKCDKNVMVVEHSVNQVTASLNMIQSIQNKEIKPIIMTVKNEQDSLKTQVQALQCENQKLKTVVRSLHKKTFSYEKLMAFMGQANSFKIQELENRLQTITQTQVKSIEMQNTYNKNMYKMTHQMKRTYSELDSRLCGCTTVKSSKNSNCSDVITDGTNNSNIII